MSHIEHFHLDYIDSLRKEGHEVLTMANGEGADFNVRFIKKMFSVKAFSTIREVKRILEKEKFDVIILNTTLAAFLIRAALPRKNRPRVVNIVHGYMFNTKPHGLKERIFLFCEKLMAKRTDAVAVMNSSDLESTKRYKLCKTEANFILGMGAELGECLVEGETIRRELDSVGKYAILFVGELYKGKNQTMLIKALPEIKKTIPEAVLWFVGDGVAWEELLGLARDVGVSDSVLFVGYKSNSADYMRACDLYASASLKEGLPFNVIEALGAGKTVIASNVKGHTDIIENGISGYLYDVKCPSQFVELVNDACSGKAVISPEEAVKTYEKYSKKNVFDKTYNVIKELARL